MVNGAGANNNMSSGVGGSFAQMSLQMSPSIDKHVSVDTEDDDEKQGTHPFYDNSSLNKHDVFTNSRDKVKEPADEPTPMITTNDRNRSKEEDETEVMTDFDIKEEENLRAQLMSSRNRWLEQ